MRRLWPSVRHVLIGTMSLGLFSPVPLRSSSIHEKGSSPTLRWDEQTPGCTFSQTDDGKLRYGLTYGDVAIALSIDSQELEKVHRRHEPFFAVFLTVRYRGQGTLEMSADNTSIEFSSHFKVLQTSLDPDAFVQKIQDDADQVDHSTAREIEKHPEMKSNKEAYMRSFQKDTAELLEFVSKRSLRSTRLTGNQEVSGWVLFGVNSKWIGKWGKQEEFILRFPLDGRMFEFPFILPPKPADIRLRRRH